MAHHLAGAILTVLLGLLAATAAAVERTEGADLGATLLARLRAGDRIRIATGEAGTVEGRFVTLQDGEVVLEGPARRVRAGDVQEVWKRGRATREGAVLGATVLGLAGAVFGFVVAAGLCEEGQSCSPSAQLELALTGIGVGVGALVGGGIGAAIPRWVEVKVAVPKPSARWRSPSVVVGVSLAW